MKPLLCRAVCVCVYAHISCGKHTLRTGLESSLWITHVASQAVVGYCDTLNSLLGVLELWLSTLGLLLLHNYNAQEPWLGNCVCEVLQKEQRFPPPTFFLFDPPLVQALPARLVCGNSTDVFHLAAICWTYDGNLSWNTASLESPLVLSIDTVDVDFEDPSFSSVPSLKIHFTLAGYKAFSAHA